MKQAAKVAFEDNIHHRKNIKKIAKVCLSSRECSVQEACTIFLLELKLRAIFLAGCFVNTYPQEERVQVLISQRELSKVTGDSPNIFKKSNIDRYMERQFILWNFCYVYFLAYYTLENK